MGDLNSILVLGRSLGEGKGYPLQYSDLENFMDCIVHGVTKSRTQLSDFHFFQTHNSAELLLDTIKEKAEEPEIQLPISAGSLKKQEYSRKTCISALLTMPKPLTVCITINCGKF